MYDRDDDLEGLEYEDEQDVRICLGCNCTDITACSTPIGPCAWSETRSGFCTSCTGEAVGSRPIYGPSGEILSMVGAA